jgi:predicted RNA-binding Zn-ribbon protein involved in translation (DUF1610 family)
MSESKRPPDECANCGAAIPRNARACPECGADERTGWRDNDATRYDGLDLPDEASESDEPDDRSLAAMRRKRARKVNGVPWYWWVVGVALLVIIALTWIV